MQYVRLLNTIRRRRKGDDVMNAPRSTSCKSRKSAKPNHPHPPCCLVHVEYVRGNSVHEYSNSNRNFDDSISCAICTLFYSRHFEKRNLEPAQFKCMETIIGANEYIFPFSVGSPFSYRLLREIHSSRKRGNIGRWDLRRVLPLRFRVLESPRIPIRQNPIGRTLCPLCRALGITSCASHVSTGPICVARWAFMSCSAQSWRCQQCVFIYGG